jgi:small subunit ribosomal protein S17
MSFERRKARIGKVISDKMDKSVVVLVEWRRTHPLYRKSMRRRSRLVAHDADNSCQVGDLIRIIESRPMSKTKRWRVAEILARQEIAELQPDEITIDQSVATSAGLGGPEAAEPALMESVAEAEAETEPAEEEPEAETEPAEEEPEAETEPAEEEAETEPAADVAAESDEGKPAP